MDFDADPMPVLSLFPLPPVRRLEQWEVLLTDLEGQRPVIGWAELERLTRVRKRTPLVCQIFNWHKKPQMDAVRLADVLKATGIDAPEDGYFYFYSADGLYWERT